MTTAEARRWFAEDLRVCGDLTLPHLVEAFATVPRERFLSVGPWQVRGLLEGGHTTDSADPALVYHNMSIAIDPARELFNGQPGLIARWLQDLRIARGERVWHVGCGTGYFTAIIGEIVGGGGHVVAEDIDVDLAARARANLSDRPWIDVRHGDGQTPPASPVDVVLVHAGATHVLSPWLDAVRDGGRVLVPVTGTMPGMPATISKGPVLLATRHGNEWQARVTSLVAIYSLVGGRDATMNAALGKAMMTGALSKVTRIRRDSHEPEATCVVHGVNCLSDGSPEVLKS